MSKSGQRRQSARDKGYSDARNCRPKKWKGDRALKRSYEEGYQIGKMDQWRNHQIRHGHSGDRNPDYDHGPYPT